MSKRNATRKKSISTPPPEAEQDELQCVAAKLRSETRPRRTAISTRRKHFADAITVLHRFAEAAGESLQFGSTSTRIPTIEEVQAAARAALDLHGNQGPVLLAWLDVETLLASVKTRFDAEGEVIPDGSLAEFAAATASAETNRESIHREARRIAGHFNGKPLRLNDLSGDPSHYQHSARSIYWLARLVKIVCEEDDFPMPTSPASEPIKTDDRKDAAADGQPERAVSLPPHLHGSNAKKATVARRNEIIKKQLAYGMNEHQIYEFLKEHHLELVRKGKGKAKKFIKPKSIMGQYKLSTAS